MGKVEGYREALRGLEDWDRYLLAHSGLPGPRGNLELARAAAEEGDEAHFRRWLSMDATRAPVGTPEEFLAFCGALGLGKLLAAGRRDILTELAQLAADPRWRTREAAAMALQWWGTREKMALLDAMQAWGHGSRWQQRAAVAAICEPALLKDERDARRGLEILNEITQTVPGALDRKTEPFRVLRQALGYGWSVAVAALPGQGKALIDQWLECPDQDVRWILRENLQKQRLVRLDPAWVSMCRERLSRISQT